MLKSTLPSLECYFLVLGVSCLGFLGPRALGLGFRVQDLGCPHVDVVRGVAFFGVSCENKT